MTTADNAPEDNLPEGQAPPSNEDSGPETDADAREREIQRRLTQSGREAAEARRQAAAAQAQLAAQTQQIGELQAGVRLLVANLSERDARDAAVRQQQIEAELASLPPADRLERKITLLQGQMDQLRTAGAQRQPAQQPPPQRQQQPQQRVATDDERRAYMEQRVQEIVNEAEQVHGVRPNLDQIPDADWDTEDAFYRAVMSNAAGQAAGGNGSVPARKQETPAQMRERIRQEERDKLGVNAPNAARSSGGSGRSKSASADDVRAAAQSYDSKLGPKANIARMQQLRNTMPG